MDILSNTTKETAEKIIKAAKVALEPNVSYDERLQAYEFLEQTKDDSRVAISCGFYLCDSNKEPQIRHLGLQFVEDTIRYHWNDISLQQKVSIKENTMLLLTSGTQDMLVEPAYIKDKISRLIVEMMKREWPQHWPELLQELERIASTGPTQTELVLLIFLRIAEDVATLQNLESNQRRKDIHQSLNLKIDSIFNFFFKLLEQHYRLYKEQHEGDCHKKYCLIIQSIFSTLACFVEWVPIYAIENHQSKFFNSMCQLISDQNIRQSAAECLLQILARKGKPTERMFVLSLVSDDVMEAVSKAADLALIDPLNEKNYLFLKELTKVVTTLGFQLCTLWGKDVMVNEPQSFSLYLNILLAFSRHPSLTIYGYTATLWGQLFRSEVIRENAKLVNIIPVWLPIAYSKVMKKGFPSKNDSDTCQYSILDFDSDDEYYGFFCKVRSETCEAFKAAAQISPDLLFTFVEEQFKECLKNDVSPESMVCLQTNWDALSQVSLRVLGQVSEDKANFTVPRARVIWLLRQCIEYKVPEQPEIVSMILTCISGLCSLLPAIPEMSQEVLVKLFECIRYTGNYSGESMPKGIKNTRKHAASLLLKLCKSFPDLFLKIFDQLDAKIKELCQTDDLLQLERVTLIQSLLILNSYRGGYDSQHLYIGRLIQSVKEDWQVLKDAFASTSSLIEYVGLGNATTDPVQLERYGLNRSKVFGCINIILAMLNRCRMSSIGETVPPADVSVVTTRNPAGPHILFLLPNIFCFMRSSNGLHMPEYLERLPPEYAKVHAIPEDEKCSLLGVRGMNAIIGEAETIKTPLQRLQVFLRTSHEHMCLILGNCGPVLQSEFYQFPHIAECLIQSLFWNFHLLPNIKLRFVIRVLKPLIEGCPPQFYESIILPVVNHVAPIMLRELQAKWEHASGVLEDDTTDEDVVDGEMLVENMMLHASTRDYLEVIAALLTEKVRNTSAKTNRPLEATDCMEECMDTDESEKPQLIQHEVMSPLGKLALKYDSICEAIVLTLLRALSWADTVSCRKAIQPLYLCIQEMVEEGYQHLNEEAVKQIFVGVLRGIHVHGQHCLDLDRLSDLAVSLYEKLQPHFPALGQVLLTLPEADAKHVKEFEKLLKNGSMKKQSKQNKLKRDAFKRVINNIIGKSVGEALKKEAQFRQLHPIFRQKRLSPPHLDEFTDDLSLCSLFGVSGSE